MSGRERARESGYTLVGLMVLIAVVNIGLAVAAGSLVTADRRAREAELIWRGQQYAGAIDCYRRSNAGEPLNRLEQLVEANCLRRLYGDPMAADGEWRVLTAQDAADGTLEELAGPPVGPGGVGVPVAEEGEGGDDSGAGPAAGDVDEEGAGAGALFGQGGRSSGPQGMGGPRGMERDRGLGSGLQLGSGFRLGFGGLGAGDAANVIIGVSSTVDRESIRLYRRRKNYRSWLFLASSGQN